MKRVSFLFAIVTFCGHVAFAQALYETKVNNNEEQYRTNADDVSPPPPDYSNLSCWAAHPAKWDYSDSIPSFLKNETRDTSVDVFFLHPTTYTNNFQNANMNADVNDSILNHQTDLRTILYQASVFNGSCRVFAPRYRQAHLKAYFQMNSDQSKKGFDIAYSDLKMAFQYYLDHWNQGRPIIIAAHSQGSMHAVRLLQDFFDSKPLQKQLVCAYIVGWQIKKDDFKNIKFGNSPSQTGCILGWRTFKKGREDFLIKRENGNSLCVNPITWAIDNNWTPKEMHKGALGKDFNKLISKKISAEVVPGINILWVELPEEMEKKSELASRLGNFHIVDYNLFWMDIRENVKQRVDAYIHRK